MKDINKIIDSLSPVEQNLMYNALQKKLNRGPEYTISYDKSGYYVKCDSPQLTAFRFEEEKYAELAYHIYNSVYGTGTVILLNTPLDFLILIQNGQSNVTGK